MLQIQYLLELQTHPGIIGELFGTGNALAPYLVGIASYSQNVR